MTGKVFREPAAGRRSERLGAAVCLGIAAAGVVLFFWFRKQIAAAPSTDPWMERQRWLLLFAASAAAAGGVYGALVCWLKSRFWVRIRGGQLIFPGIPLLEKKRIRFPLECIDPAASLSRTLKGMPPRRSLILIGSQGTKITAVPFRVRHFCRLFDAVMRTDPPGRGRPAAEVLQAAPAVPKSRLRRFAAGISAAVFAVSMLAAAYRTAGFFEAEKEFARNPREAPGQVLFHYTAFGQLKNIFGFSPYRMVYTFAREPGGREQWGGDALPEAVWRQYARGDAVQVRWLPQNPFLTRIEGKGPDTLLPWILGTQLFFAVTSAAGLGYGLFRRKQKPPPAG